MDEWWKQGELGTTGPLRQPCAVAYYRHSAQDRQENSIPIQQEQVRKWAGEHGIVIIKEFADHGKSGLSAEHRDGFTSMIEEWVKKRGDFEYVLVLDVSRWGRFQDVDLSATYSSECTKHGKTVVYTSIGLPKKDDPFHSMVIGFERYRAAQYSRELSEKVFKGCAKIAEQGFRPGGQPPYGLHRLLLNEAHRPVQILKPGERKSIQNQRVTLAPGDDGQVAIVRRVFEECALQRRVAEDIAEGLNRDSVPSPGGARWSADKVRHILRNELYIGTMVYNKSRSRLLAPSRQNPREEWIRTPSAFDGIVTRDLFEQANSVLGERTARRSPVYLLDALRKVYERNGIITRRLIKACPEAPSLNSYGRHFHGLDGAFQHLFPDMRADVTRRVRAKLMETVNPVEDFSDFVVLAGRLTVLVQPSAPVPNGYECYWPFRPDQRTTIDITLGIPLSGGNEWKILGYVALPRLLVRSHAIRVHGASDSRIELFGHDGLDFIKELLA